MKEKNKAQRRIQKNHQYQCIPQKNMVGISFYLTSTANSSRLTS